MNKLKVLLSCFVIFAVFFSQSLFASGYASVSGGINISASPVVLGKNFSISFTLHEVRGESKTFENVAIAILDSNDNFVFDFAMYSNITVNSNGYWSSNATNYIYPTRFAGTYKAVIRGKYAGSWFDFDATGNGVTPKAFSVVTGQTKPSPLNSSYMGNVVQKFGVWNSSFVGYHTGYDIGTANSNPAVYAIANGIVVWNSTASQKYTTNYTKYWNAFVIVKHGNFYAYYGHINSSLGVGSTIIKGSKIGTIRNAYTRSNILITTNNHLHFSVSTGTNWIKSEWGYQPTKAGLNQFVDPKSYINLR